MINSISYMPPAKIRQSCINFGKSSDDKFYEYGSQRYIRQKNEYNSKNTKGDSSETSIVKICATLAFGILATSFGIFSKRKR